ncbi:RES family NAD+ phosphorylase [Halomonas sp. Bachu 37]|uniref:RES family NAD+ phosphorylase n=1 Tax=Halomonas kashgarensis TaxID=3084920 RepID=UPI003217365C
MVALEHLPRLPARPVKGYRLVNSKFPPISLFEDVASADEFESLYELQALTNPRILTEAGNLALVARDEIPFGISGCTYATAPFTHVTPDGSRFSDGSFGILYMADALQTAIAEVKHHQQAYWRNVPSLNYERFTFRGLACEFDEAGVRDGLVLPPSDPIYSANDYSAARQLGAAMRDNREIGIRYHSVREANAVCWGLMTPKPVRSIVQTAHYEMIWNQGITTVIQVSRRY